MSLAAKSKSLRLDSLSTKLHNIDPTDAGQLRALYDELRALADGGLTPKSVSLPASKLSVEDVVDYIGLSNPKRSFLGFTKVDIPDWTCTPDPTFREERKKANFAPPGWLEHTILVFNTLWGHRNEASRRLIVELLVTDALWHFYQRNRVSPNLESSLDEGPRPMRAFGEITFTHRVSPSRSSESLIITGRCDIAFGYGDDRRGSPSEDTFLGVLEVKTPSELESGFPQLLAYLATLHHSRKAARKINSTVYGILTDSQRYVFVKVNNDSQAFRSKTYEFVDDMEEIYDFLFTIVQRAALSSPSSSPMKPPSLMQEQVHNFEEVEQTVFVHGYVLVDDPNAIVLD